MTTSYLMDKRPELFINIEGMDGVGKTTTARMLSNILGFKFVKTKIGLLYDDANSSNCYRQLQHFIDGEDNPLLKAWFYGLGNFYLYHKFDGKCIVTDKYLYSNYKWDKSQDSEVIFETILKVLGKPDITFLLEADEEVRRERIINRNSNDPDLSNNDLIIRADEHLKILIHKFKIKYEIINTTSMTCEQVCESIIEKLKKNDLL